MAEVIEIVDDAGATQNEWWGVIGGDIFRAQSGQLHPANGWELVKMTRADFRELILKRSHRLRMNALSGAYQYDTPPA
jgi:hypothetical protein